MEAAVLFWLHQAQHAVRVGILRALRARGREITAEQWTVLTALWQRGECGQSELAERTGRDHPGTSRAVDGLERQGLVDRLPDPDDRRAVRVRLTGAGARIHEMLEPAVEETQRAALAGFSTAERKVLRDALARIHANLRAASDSPEPKRRRGPDDDT